MSALTRSEIIDLAIKQAGSDIAITPLAEMWLDNILDRLYEDHKWPFQMKTEVGSVGDGVAVALPTDYLDFWNRYGLKLIDSNGKSFAMLIRDTDYLDLVSDPNILGKPDVAVIDMNARTIRLYPLPDQNYGYQLRYKYKPTRLSDVTGVTDPKPVFPNDQLLVEAIFTMILQYEDDERAAGDLAFLDALVRRYKHGNNKAVTKSDTMQLNPEVFKKIFPLR